MNKVQYQGKTYFENGTGVLFDDKNNPVLVRHDGKYVKYDPKLIEAISKKRAEIQDQIKRKQADSAKAQAETDAHLEKSYQDKWNTVLGDEKKN